MTLSHYTDHPHYMPGQETVIGAPCECCDTRTEEYDTDRYLFVCDVCSQSQYVTYDMEYNGHTLIEYDSDDQS